jgi:uncharacterized protein (TIRG00374 family)
MNWTGWQEPGRSALAIVIWLEADSMKEPDQHMPLESKRCYRLLWLGRAVVTSGLVAYLGWRLYGEMAGIHLHLARPWFLALALTCAVLGILISARLWYGLILPPIQVPFRQILAHYLNGLFWNNFLPTAFGGDAVRVLSLRHVIGQTDAVVNSVLLARLAGLWSIIILACVTAQINAIHLGWQVGQLSLFVTIGALFLAIVGTFFLFGATITALVKRFPSSWTRWHASLHAYRQHKARLWQALGWAFAIQMSAIAINIFAAQALDLSISPRELILCLPLINLIALLPISIGGFGVREGSYVYFLGLFGISVANAIVLALTVFAILTFVTGVGAGFFTLLIPSMKKISKFL